MIFQRTLKKPICITGVGVHSGQKVTLTLLPARANAGVVFKRTDLKNAPKISAHYKNIINTQLATTLGRGKITVGTVEHVLAALQGLGIDNASLELNGPEVPILDGSSQGFCEAILASGVETQAQPRTYLALRRKVELHIGDKWAMVEPSSRLEIHASVQWDHPSIGQQEFHYIEGKTPFSELSSARTFGFLKELEALKKLGLARGGSLSNVIVLDHQTVLNPEGLRFADEFVRHKALDALGDLKLAGVPIQGRFFFHRAGHEIHRQLLLEVFKNPDNFEIFDPSHERRPLELPMPLTQPGFAVSY